MNVEININKQKIAATSATVVRGIVATGVFVAKVAGALADAALEVEAARNRRDAVTHLGRYRGLPELEVRSLGDRAYHNTLSPAQRDQLRQELGKARKFERENPAKAKVIKAL